MSRTKPPCRRCTQVHLTTWTVAVGRFDANGPAGYRATFNGAPLRTTRQQAEQDMCDYQQTNRSEEVELA